MACSRGYELQNNVGAEGTYSNHVDPEQQREDNKSTERAVRPVPQRRTG